MANTFFEFCVGPLAEAGESSDKRWIVLRFVDGVCRLGFIKIEHVPVQRLFLGRIEWHSEVQPKMVSVDCSSIQELLYAFMEHEVRFPDCLIEEWRVLKDIPNNYYGSHCEDENQP